ncbi:MAG: hypothetical protein MK212_04425 [Saprospiraceae bacterium]|nr:hypothetical protein [Saprospiraceae bacterium]
MLPKKAVLSKKTRARVFNNQVTTAGVQYTDKAKTSCPILPLQVWAATYDLDIVMVSKHQAWNMHEFARVATPQGAVWLMKDAREGSLDQCLIADIPDLDFWLPELPVQRKYYPVRVEDKSTSKLLQFNFAYENILGEQVKASYKGKRIKTKMKKRNGSTMGHSQNHAMVVLDLPYRDFGKKASMQFDGKTHKIQKLLGIVPFCMALQQTQGGLSIGEFNIKQLSDKLLQTSHPIKDTFAVQEWNKYPVDNGFCIEQKGDFRTLRYFFSDTLGKLELKAASAQQWNYTNESFRIEFERPLPDLRYPFQDTFQTKFVLDIGEQKSHGLGTVQAYWENDSPVLKLLPERPWWVADRPMQTHIDIINESEVKIQIQRIH